MGNGAHEWYSTCLASTKPSVQTPVPPFKKERKKKIHEGKGTYIGEEKNI
jgi:hypothetical protein